MPGAGPITHSQSSSASAESSLHILCSLLHVIAPSVSELRVPFLPPALRHRMFRWHYYPQIELLILCRNAAPSPKGSHNKYSEPRFAWKVEES